MDKLDVIKEIRENKRVFSSSIVADIAIRALEAWDDMEDEVIDVMTKVVSYEGVERALGVDIVLEILREYKHYVETGEWMN